MAPCSVSIGRLPTRLCVASPVNEGGNSHRPRVNPSEGQGNPRTPMNTTYLVAPRRCGRGSTVLRLMRRRGPDRGAATMTRAALLAVSSRGCRREKRDACALECARDGQGDVDDVRLHPPGRDPGRGARRWPRPSRRDGQADPILVALADGWRSPVDCIRASINGGSRKRCGSADERASARADEPCSESRRSRTTTAAAGSRAGGGLQSSPPA